MAPRVALCLVLALVCLHSCTGAPASPATTTTSPASPAATTSPATTAATTSPATKSPAATTSPASPATKSPAATTSPASPAATTSPASPAATTSPATTTTTTTASPAVKTPTSPATATTTTPASKSPATPATKTPTTTAATAGATTGATVAVNRPVPVASPSPPPTPLPIQGAPANPPPAAVPPPPPFAPTPPDYTAVQAVIQVAGTGVSPFNTTKQAVLLIAVSSVMTTVTQQQIGIILVEPATSQSRRRMLLAQMEPLESELSWRSSSRHLLANSTVLNNVVDVTMNFNTSDGTSVSAVINELDTQYTNGNLASALQAQGYNWGLNLESANAALPQGRQSVPHQCVKKWSSFCLDGTDLNASGVKAIIAVGVIIVVALITGLLVWLDVRRRSGAAGELQYAPDSPWHATPMARYLGMLTNGRIGTPRAGHGKGFTPKAGTGAPGSRAVSMTAHTNPNLEGGTPDSSAATVSPVEQHHTNPLV